MRAEGDAYWSTGLPKNHDALQELDAYCKEWGGLTRAEATRRILIEWQKIRRGQDVSSWGPNAAVRLAGSASTKEVRSATASQKGPPVTPTARAASQALDE